MKSIEEIREEVKHYLESRGMSARQFCLKYHYSPGHFSDWLNGNRNFSQARVMSLEMIIGGKYFTDERISGDVVLQTLIERWQMLTPSERYEILSFVEKIIEKKTKST